MKAIPLCCTAAAFSLLFFSCGSSYYSRPKKLVPVEPQVWNYGVPIHTDTVQSVNVMVQQAWYEESKYVFELRFENQGHKGVEINPEKFYTLQSLSNGKRMGAYAFTAEHINRMMNEKRDAQLKNDDGLTLMMLLLPFAVLAAVAEADHVNNMSKEDRRAYEQQRTLDRIERNQRDAENNRRREREATTAVVRLEEYYLPPLQRHMLMPGQIHKGRVFFPALADVDSLRLMLPVVSDTVQFRYSVTR